MIITNTINDYEEAIIITHNYVASNGGKRYAITKEKNKKVVFIFCSLFTYSYRTIA